MRADRLFIAAVASLASLAVAQTPTPHLADPQAISFDLIHQAETQNWYSLSQFRFCRTTDATGLEQWVGLAEELDVAPPASGETTERFDLRLATGLGLDPVEEQRQQTVHTHHRAYLYQHGTFRVQDPQLAASNYAIHYEGDIQRLGRPAYRVSIIPNSGSANCWILDLDVETGYPMSRSEYDQNSGELLSMITVTEFAHGAAAQAAADGVANWWVPTHRTDYPTPTAAINAAARPSTFKLPSKTPDGFALQTSSMLIDPLNGNETLMLSYTDGIESVLFLETPGAPKPNVPVYSGPDAYAILDFSDLTSKQLMFFYGGVQYLTLGGSDNAQVDTFTENLLRQVVGKR